MHTWLYSLTYYLLGRPSPDRKPPRDVTISMHPGQLSLASPPWAWPCPLRLSDHTVAASGSDFVPINFVALLLWECVKYASVILYWRHCLELTIMNFLLLVANTVLTYLTRQKILSNRYYGICSLILYSVDADFWAFIFTFVWHFAWFVLFIVYLVAPCPFYCVCLYCMLLCCCLLA